MTKNTFDNPFTKIFADMPFDTSAFDTGAFGDVFKNSAAVTEKFTKVALAAAEKNAEISNKWTQATLAKLATATTAPAEPADYSKAMSDFASASVETASEHVAAFAEVAKKVQMDTVELLMAAGKEVQAEASAAVKKATTEATGAVKKAASKAA